jgi:hypothetical protein
MYSDLPSSQPTFYPTVTSDGGTYNTSAPQSNLRGNPPTIGIIPKFKRIPFNINTTAGILDFQSEGDRISPGNVSDIYIFFNQNNLFNIGFFSNLFFLPKFHN